MKELNIKIMDIDKKANFSEWYDEALKESEILDSRYNSKGMFIWLPYGFKIMRRIKEMWDKLFQDAGIQECYFPQLVPIEYAEQNKSWWDGFKEEGYLMVTGKNKEVQGIIRPTGEPAIYPMYKLWIRTFSDLPLRLYQTTSSFRYESKSTRPLIRDREITMWHEIHTAHATKEEAEKEVDLHIKLWDKLWDKLALPVWKVRKPQWECFAGAVGAIEYYTLFPSARVMETGSVNNLGQAYAKEFDIKFKDTDEKEHFVWQVCTGVGARLLAAIISIHGDRKGIIVPPEIAPTKCVIVPIMFKGKEQIILKKAKEIESMLKKENISVFIDSRDEIAAGRKFYEWEAKGIPLRIEIGPRDLEKNQITIVRRDSNEKVAINESKVIEKVRELLDNIQKSLLKEAEHELKKSIVDVITFHDIKKAIKNKKVARVFWCKSRDCYDIFGGIGDGIEGIGTDLDEKTNGKCIVCGKETKARLFIGKSY